MSKPNARLTLQFSLDLRLPDDMAGRDHGALCRELCEALGTTVIKGLPAISTKQLAKAGVSLLAHHHHATVENFTVPVLDATTAARVAAHLTDDEIGVLCRDAAPQAPDAEPELLRYLRRQALAMVSEYRLVPCRLTVLQSSGASGQLDGRLNLTNGSVMLGEAFRKVRLKSDQGPIPVAVEGLGDTLRATLSGHTLSGPVLAVAVDELVPHRAHLIRLWQQT
ncbi:MAG: hypothetical protein KDH15_17785 [Rhodocyclaceae bacterium]|nr:hypothetical protein [Rhodocyclaceae bacterium]